MKNPSMSFLDASKLIRDVSGFSEQDLCIKTSASMHQLNLYLKAMGAKRDINYNIKQIDFGTLKQNLYDNKP